MVAVIVNVMEHSACAKHHAHITAVTLHNPSRRKVPYDR